MVYREGYAHVVDSGMQVATRFSERVGVCGFVQVESQVYERVTVGEGCNDT